MDALGQPFDPLKAAASGWLPFSPRAVWPFLLLFAGGIAASIGDGVPREVALALGAAGFHGALVAAALASALGRSGWQRPAWLIAVALFGATAAAQREPWGAAAYLVVPLALAALGARHAELGRIGLRRPESNVAWLLGAGAGLFLGGHLLLSASRTFGYPIQPAPAAPVLAAIAYDAGANVISAELFFRGVIFNFWHRRQGFWAGATLSTGACLLRYVLDPALPRTVEVTIGAVFYVTLLSLASCALLALSGSLLPSMLAGLCFFGAYRTLRPS